MGIGVIGQSGLLVQKRAVVAIILEAGNVTILIRQMVAYHAPEMRQSKDIVRMVLVLSVSMWLCNYGEMLHHLNSSICYNSIFVQFCTSVHINTLTRWKLGPLATLGNMFSDLWWWRH